MCVGREKERVGGGGEIVCVRGERERETGGGETVCARGEREGGGVLGAGGRESQRQKEESGAKKKQRGLGVERVKERVSRGGVGGGGGGKKGK